jgi:hypothetical protein
MDIQVTVRQAAIIRAGTFAPGNDDRKREARDLRRKINRPYNRGQTQNGAVGGFRQLCLCYAVGGG